MPKTMNDSCFFTITVLLILWVLTLLALVNTCRKRRDDEGPVDFRSEMLLGLVAQGKKEADAAARRLVQVADALSIGLVETGREKGIKGLNPLARELLELGEGLEDSIASLKEGMETVFRTRDGRVFQLKHLGGQGSVSLVVIQEVTHTYNWMERLKGKEKLALLGQMTAQMAHQLKTPLAVLAGQAQMLAKRLAGHDDLQGRARAIYEEARSLAEQVGEISAFYKGKGVSPSEICLHSVLEEVRSRLRPEDDKFRIRIECPRDLSVKTDPALLRNLLVLLSQNALEPEIGATELLLKAECRDEEVIVSVEDNGKGIPEELGQKIFEPFVGTREDGLGLGLFLAKDLTEQLGGSILLADTPVGTRFDITLPVSD